MSGERPARRHRRATREATGGAEQRGVRPDQTSDDVEPERGGERDDERTRWLREQRPPHWGR